MTRIGLLLLAVIFTNISHDAGLTQSFPNGGSVTKQYIIETTGSGIAMIDYDNDGLLDIFVLSGEGGTNRMYHNEGHDRFREVTDAVGLHSSGWAQGVCTGDYDNDGFTDLFVTYWGQNHLYRNIGGKRFEDVTRSSHLLQDRIRYNTGCAFVDIDNDGHLDLFVANYLKFDPATTPKPGANPYCFYRAIPVSCGPRGLPFDHNILYRNNGAGIFADISENSGIVTSEGHYSLSVLTGDFNNDGLPDIYVACDQTPSLLYINQGNGKFEEEGVLRGAAFDQNGRAMSGMGLDAASYDARPALNIFRTNFSDEFETLYRNRGDGNFDDVTLDSGLGKNTSYVGWGTGFFDFDNDGWKDILLVNGHVFPEVEKLHIDIHYKDRPILYQNLRNGKFADISKDSGPAFAELHSARGAAFGDIDNDGAVEVAVNNQNEPPSLFQRSGSGSGHWILLKLQGIISNRSAIGARVTLKSGAHLQYAEVRSGGSYLSQNDLRLHFGLGTAKSVDSIEIQWPSGTHQILTAQPADRVLEIKEPTAAIRANKKTIFIFSLPFQQLTPKSNPRRKPPSPTLNSETIMSEQQNLPVTDPATAAAEPQENSQPPKRNCGRTGPTSESGKATSSRNATRHGLCSSTLIIDGETEEDWQNLLTSWLTQYQNPAENSVLYTFVVKTAQADWFRQRAQNEFDYFLAVYAQRAMCSWDAQSLKTHDLLLRYVTAGERKFQREYRLLEHHWKAHPKPVPAEQTTAAPPPDPANVEVPLVLFVNNETGESVDAQGNQYPAPPNCIPTPIIPGVYPPGHLCYHEPTATPKKGDRQRR